jgi:hypothetical protein
MRNVSVFDDRMLIDELLLPPSIVIVRSLHMGELHNISGSLEGVKEERRGQREKE